MREKDLEAKKAAQEGNERFFERLEPVAKELERILKQHGLEVVKTENTPSNEGKSPTLALAQILHEDFCCRDFMNCSL